jgi:hypothetical protein
MIRRWVTAVVGIAVLGCVPRGIVVYELTKFPDASEWRPSPRRFYVARSDQQIVFERVENGVYTTDYSVYKYTGCSVLSFATWTCSNCTLYTRDIWTCGERVRGTFEIGMKDGVYWQQPEQLEPAFFEERYVGALEWHRARFRELAHEEGRHDEGRFVASIRFLKEELLDW